MNKISWCVMGGIVLGILLWLGWSFWQQPVAEAPGGAFENGQPAGWTEPTEEAGDLTPTEPLPIN